MGELMKVQEERGPLAPIQMESVIGQVKAIQALMKEVMKEGQDYGVIPGCDKPTLLKAGAEKLAFYFRLGSRYDITVKDLPGGHKDINCLCTIYSLRTSEVLGQGVGSCSTLESKYRWRFEDVGPVPQQYWRHRDPSALGEPGLTVRKKGKDWRVFRRIETDPADSYNTVLKMAKKRSYVDGILTVTAASELFTQDVEETVEGEVVNGSPAAQAPASDELRTAKDVVGTSQGPQARTPDWWNMKAPEFLRLYARTDETVVSAWSSDDRKLWKRKCDQGVKMGLPTWWPKEPSSDAAEEFARLLDLGMGIEEARETAERAEWDPSKIDLLIRSLGQSRQAVQAPLI